MVTDALNLQIHGYQMASAFFHHRPMVNLMAPVSSIDYLNFHIFLIIYKRSLKIVCSMLYSCYIIVF